MAALALEQLYAAGALLADSDEDGVADTVRATLVWERTAEAELVVASLALAARLALHAIALTQPLASWADQLTGPPECLIRISGSSERGDSDAIDRLVPGEWGVIQEEGAGLVIRGSTVRGGSQAAHYLAAGYPFLEDNHTPLTGYLGTGGRVLRLYVDAATAGLRAILWQAEAQVPPPAQRSGWASLAIDSGHCLLLNQAASAKPRCQVELSDRRAYLTRPTKSLSPSPWSGDLLDLYEAGGFWHSCDGVAPALLRTCLSFEQYHAELMPAAAEFIARLALESTALLFPVATLGAPPQDSHAGVRLLTKLVETPARAGACLSTDGASLSLGYSHPRHGQRALSDMSRWPSRWTSERTDASWGAQVIAPPAETGGEMAADETIQWDFPWEGEALLSALTSALPDLPQQPLLVDAGVFESLTVRSELAEQLQELLEESGRQGKVQVRCAFKSGLHWVEEEVIPVLQQLGTSVHHIIISFPYLKPKAGLLELPIRWLQELYPVDELLAQALDLTDDRISFERREENAGYRLAAYAEDESLLWAEERPIAAAYLPYLPQESQQPPYALVSRSWLRIYEAGSPIPQHAEEFAGDAERFWQRYQDEFLPHLQQRLSQRQAGGDAPPLDGLDVEVWMSQPERRLGIGEELISPLEALHQDIYFTTLDACRQRGFRQPGPVRPWLHLRERRGASALIQLRWRAQPAPMTPVSPLRAWCWPKHAPAHGCCADGTHIAAPLPIALSDSPPPPIALPDIPLDEVLGPEQSDQLVRALGTHPRCNAYPVAHSYQGRAVYALEISSLPIATVLSRYKLSFFKPTCLIQARKHANEVSSTNANLKLACELLDGELTPLLQHINVVLVPFANPDGGALHYAMQQEHPHWKLHAARFNAAGIDISAHQGRLDTPFGESLVYPRLWQRWLPDVSLDDHGVPSHEWLHLFSGYNSPPAFSISYWLPHSHLYAIVVGHDHQQGPWRAVQEDFRQALIEEVGRHDWLVAANRHRRERHHKYGRAWLSEPFAIEEHGHMVFYTWPVRPNRSMGQHPHITYIDCITEVADETAQGDYLRQSQAAHYIADCAALRWLAERPRTAGQTQSNENVEAKQRRKE